MCARARVVVVCVCACAYARDLVIQICSGSANLSNSWSLLNLQRAKSMPASSSSILSSCTGSLACNRFVLSALYISAVQASICLFCCCAVVIERQVSLMSACFTHLVCSKPTAIWCRASSPGSSKRTCAQRKSVQPIR